MSCSWIAIYNNTPSAKIVFVSDSITDVCGWEPKEIVGKQGSHFFHPEDRENLLKAHKVNIVKERMASMVSYRFLQKDGSYIILESVINYCYDLLVTTNYVHEQDTLEHGMRISTVDEVFICQPKGKLELAGSWNERQENILKIVNAQEIWKEDLLVMPLEKKFCLILNRFTHSLHIMYASHCIDQLVFQSPQRVVGKSFFEFVNERDISVLHSQIDMAKEHGAVVRVRFDWLMGEKKDISGPVEGIASSTNDGIVLIIRLSPKLVMDRIKPGQ